MKFSTKNIVITTVCILIVFFAAFPLLFYTKLLPEIVSNQKIITMVEEAAEKNLKVNVDIEKPVLKTALSPEISFKLTKLSITKEKEHLLDINNLDTKISFKRILEKRIILKKIGVDYVYADVNKLLALAPKQQKQEKQPEFDWKIMWFDSLMYVKKCIIIYDLNKETNLKITAINTGISSKRNPKYLVFNIFADLTQNGKVTKFAIDDNHTVYIKDRKLFIDKGTLCINKSKVFINATSDEDNKFDLTVFSDKFNVKDVVELLNTNLVIPNGSEMLSFFKDIKGSFNFKINLKNDGMTGKILVNKSTLKVIPVNNLPVYLEKGVVDITKNTITLKDFNGWYGSSKSNVATMTGTIKDYTKSVDTYVEINGKATNDLTKNYLSKLIGYPVTLTGPCGAKMVVKSIYNKMDFSIMGKVPKGQDILIDGASLSPVGYDRAFKADMHLESNMLDIKNINYYIAKELNKNSKNVKPLVTITGKYDCQKFLLHNLGFEIPNPLPSEFLNVLIGQKMFRKGLIYGHLQFINTGKVPKLEGNLAMEKVRIPSQRLYIAEGRFFTDKNYIHLTSNGKFKRSSYDFDGKLNNAIVFPVVIKDIHLKVDNIDVERMMMSMNKQNTQQVSDIKKETEKVDEATLVSASAEEASYDTYTFDTGLLIVERCILEVVQGFYKDIKFGNLKANLTLDKNGVLQINSNRFDFAEGISSLKVKCDLMKHEYYIRLGVKDINSDIIATTLLALPREISGKAMGLIELNTDDSFKINGRIRFDVSNGTIQKVGLIEYALKFAALFRNPMAMISPSTIVDLVNVPEGTFDKINGDLVLKDNVVEKIMIKSAAQQLSSFIIGRYDLTTGDASLRIYTKFSNKNKGFAGFLRNISLNSLANRVNLSGRNDSLYYAAELKQLPPIDAEEKDCQVFLTKVDGDVQNFNFLSSLKKIK